MTLLPGLWRAIARWFRHWWLPNEVLIDAIVLAYRAGKTMHDVRIEFGFGRVVRVRIGEQDVLRGRERRVLTKRIARAKTARVIAKLVETIADDDVTVLVEHDEHAVSRLVATTGDSDVETFREIAKDYLRSCRGITNEHAEAALVKQFERLGFSPNVERYDAESRHGRGGYVE
jgi:hypothetical protein